MTPAPLNLAPLELAGRLDRLRPLIDQASCSALLITNLTNIRYLTGFTGSAGVLWVEEKEAWLITDGRYRSQAAAEVAATDTQREITSDGGKEKLIGLAKNQTTIGLEANNVTWADQQNYVNWFAPTAVTPTSGLVEELRSIKDPGEIDRIENAGHLADQALAAVTDLITPGATEKEIAQTLEKEMMVRGADGTAFTTLVASGPNSARPHAQPTDRQLEEGDLVICDFGAQIDGYRSDMTRSFRVGGTGQGPKADLLQAVLQAQQAGLNAVANGVPLKDIDAACRNSLQKSGLGDAFIHGTGHGVGLDIHEAPAVSSRSTDNLRTGQVITVEPGAYLEELGGVRWEDTLVVTETGHRALTKAPKTL
ncbi:MAG: aminopeptidase P family protein [Actinobacteria bacterium]|nr:aminopeptidase P family protein [Actinomycetota bacterium]MBT3745639.1 aminopeptidase P family protein [Actinomycetota bacterium]MBT3968800.1 aminopeptidase P family protein [Actinomycetota bacterium]MBT4010024.1 aminopeptidase P family protein [Actinomycetota bacterium]MBT4303199.1 aminopeptidase P family protein [Actinomycetota bacterium]